MPLTDEQLDSFKNILNRVLEGNISAFDANSGFLLLAASDDRASNYIDQVESATKNQERDASTLFKLGFCYQLKKRYSEADDYYDQAIYLGYEPAMSLRLLMYQFHQWSLDHRDSNWKPRYYQAFASFERHCNLGHRRGKTYLAAMYQFGFITKKRPDHSKALQLYIEAASGREPDPQAMT